MSVTNGWDVVVGFNQDYLTSSITQMYEDGTFPSSFNQGIYVLTLTQPSLTISTTPNTLELNVPFTGTQAGQPISGSLTIDVDVSQMAAAIVSQPDYLQSNGDPSDTANCGAISPIASSSCTLEAWIKTTTKSAQNIFVFDSETPALSLNNNHLSLLWGNPNSSNDTSEVSDGNWHHIAVVVATDPATSLDTITFYKDGQAKDSMPLFGGKTQTSTGNLQLGSVGKSVASFNGALTQARVWKVARTAQQIQQSMNTALSSTETGLLGYWTFADKTFTNLVNGQSGSVSGSATIENLDSPTSSSYLYVFDPDSAFTVTSIVNGNANKTLANTVLTALTNYFAEPRISPFESNGSSALLPTLTDFITLIDKSNTATNELLALMKTNHAAPPAGDPNQAFAGSTQLQIPGGSNMVAALWDYIFFNYIVAPAVAQFLKVPSSQIIVTAGDPSTLSFNGSATISSELQISSLAMHFTTKGLYIGIQGQLLGTLINMTLSTTMNIVVGPATTAADKIPQNNLFTLQQADDPAQGYRVTLHNRYGEGDDEQLTLTFSGTYASLQWNQSDPTVITVESLAAAFPIIVGMCLLPCCVVSNGEIISGAHGSAGEISNLPLGGDPFDPANRLHGTLEAAVGSAGITRRYVEAGGAPGLTVRDLFDRMLTDDDARRTIDETTRLLALAVVSVAATIDPQIVVFGGSIGGRAELVEAVRKHLALLMTTPVEIAGGELGNRAGLAGALAIGINNIHNALFAPSVSPHLLSLPTIAGMRGIGFAS